MNRLEQKDSLLGVLLLSFPVIVNLLAGGGFLVGDTLSKWQGVVAFMGVSACCYFQNGGWLKRGILMFKVWAVLLASILAAGFWVMYSGADAEAYHRPASLLLSNGWNPVFDSDPDAIRNLAGKGVRLYHVAYLPRAAWVYGAVLYTWFGFLEVADSLNVLALIVSFVYVFRWLRGFSFSGSLCCLLTVLFCVSPVVAGGMFGGAFDSAYYSFLLIAMVCSTLYLTERRHEYLVAITCALVMIAGIKFTGVVSGIALLFVFSAALLLDASKTIQHAKEMDISRRWFSSKSLKHLFSPVHDWVIMSVAVVVLLGIVGFSPYVTNWVRHGGPFYPAHTFDKRIVLKDYLTYDFGFMNDDARQMGFCGRFCYGYVSQKLVYAYYRQKLGKIDFRPNFKVSGGVSGFGTVFRVAFVISSFLLLVVRTGRLKWCIGFILLTVLMQPTLYSGYARYVPQFYLFPIFVGLCLYLNLRTKCRFRKALSSGVVVVFLAGYAVVLLIYPVSFWALQWVVSVQNLSIIEAIKEDSAPVVTFRTYCSRHSLEKDYSVSITVQESCLDKERNYTYSSYFSPYTYYSRTKIPAFPHLLHEVSGNDSLIIQSRNTRNIRIFIKDFLPGALLGLPAYTRNVLMLRLAQFARE